MSPLQFSSRTDKDFHHRKTFNRSDGSFNVTSTQTLASWLRWFYLVRQKHEYIVCTHLDKPTKPAEYKYLSWQKNKKRYSQQQVQITCQKAVINVPAWPPFCVPKEWRSGPHTTAWREGCPPEWCSSSLGFWFWPARCWRHCTPHQWSWSCVCRLKTVRLVRTRKHLTMLTTIDSSFSESLMSPLAFSSRTGQNILIESSTKEDFYRHHERNVPSEPHEKFPESNLRARYFLFPPRTLTVWILRGPSYEKRAVLTTSKSHKRHKNSC